MNYNKKEKNKLNKNNEEIEDTTKYGEFISTFFTWNTLRQQKERAKEMENMTKKK